MNNNGIDSNENLVNLPEKLTMGLTRAAMSITYGSSRLVVLIYHRVMAEPDEFWDGDVDARTFDWHMKTLKDNFRVFALSDAVKRLAENSLPYNSVCITFDDGYADNHDVALPILNKYQLPATFFIASGFLDGGRMWNDTVIESVRNAPGPVLDLKQIELDEYDIATPEKRRNAVKSLLGKIKYLPLENRLQNADNIAQLVKATLPDNLMMTSVQVKAMRENGMEIGGHTVNHPILNQVSDDIAYQEILQGKEKLENILGEKITAFAFPNGRPGRDYNARHVNMVKQAGFECSVSTANGIAGIKSDKFQLPRIVPWDRSAFRLAMRLYLSRFYDNADTV